MRRTLTAVAGGVLALVVGACTQLPTMQDPTNRLGDTVGQPRDIAEREIRLITCEMLDDGHSPEAVAGFFMANEQMIPFTPDRTDWIIRRAVAEDCPEHADRVSQSATGGPA